MYQTIKVRRVTYRSLKLLAAQRGESMLDLIDRLVAQDMNVASNVAQETEDKEERGVLPLSNAGAGEEI